MHVPAQRKKSHDTPAASDLDTVSSLQVTGAGPARGSLRVPCDKSISHRAVLMAAMAHGSSVITGLSQGQDVTHTLRAVERFGVIVTDAGDGRVRLEGPIRHEPDDVLDHGNAGTGIRLTAAVCAGIDGISVLTGDRFLRRRPMERIAAPLRLMGASVDGRQGGNLAPLVIRGGSLTGITYAPKVASAQVKGRCCWPVCPLRARPRWKRRMRRAGTPRRCWPSSAPGCGWTLTG